jgi:hypothetical protein
MIARSSRLALVAMLAGLVVSGCGGSTRTVLRSPQHPVSHPIDYLPGGDRRVALVPAPGVGHLAIFAERYRFEGRIYLDIAYQFHERDGASGGSSVHTNTPGPLAWTFGGECAHAGGDASVAVVGLLRVPADTVLAYVHGGPRRLRTATIPAYLHPGGVAVYGLLGEPPERIVVRTPQGAVAMSEALGRQGPTRCTHEAGIMYFVKRAK